MRRREHQRRADFEGVAMDARGRDQDAVVAQAVDEAGGAGGVRLAIGDDVLPQKQTRRAEGAKAVMAVGQRQKPIAEQGADLPAWLDQLPINRA